MTATTHVTTYPSNVVGGGNDDVEVVFFTDNNEKAVGGGLWMDRSGSLHWPTKWLFRDT